VALKSIILGGFVLGLQEMSVQQWSCCLSWRSCCLWASISVLMSLQMI